MSEPDQAAPQPRIVEFESARRAALVEPVGSRDAAAVIAALGLEAAHGRPVLLVCGGADDLEAEALERARRILGPTVIATARLTGMAVVDGGTASGVMLLTGAARAKDPTTIPVLVGVAPAGKVTYPGASRADGTALEPNHSHFALAAGQQWGDETDLMMALADALAGGAPVAMLLAGGGSVAKEEALEATARGWPIFVIEGTGGTADEIVRTRAAHQSRMRGRFGRGRPSEIAAPPDPSLRRIVADGDVRSFAGEESAQLTRQIAWELQDEPVLKDAWRTFATYDDLAKRARTAFERFQNSILLLGILATLLALLAAATGAAALHWVAVAGPILVASVIALANRRAAGKHWVHLRAAAESAKAEIYRFRTRAGIYADSKVPAQDPAARPRVLAVQLDRIELALAQTDASSGSLRPYSGPLPPEMYGAGRDDDGLSALDPGRYLLIRLADQLSYYSGRVTQLDRRRTKLQVVAVFAGGSGAILAAAGVEAWIGLTTVISAAALSYLAYLQVDNTIVTYNQSASRLRCLERDWIAGDRTGQDHAAFDALVTQGEAVLGTELSGWVQQMTQTVNRLQQEQEAAERGTRTQGKKTVPPR
jgi:hypothetical protein